MTSALAPGPVVLDIVGTELTSAEHQRLRHPLVGMVILFARNFRSLEQLGQLCEQIHALRAPPLLIAVDHEGGRVQRFRAGFTPLPPLAAFGRLWEHEARLGCQAALAAGFVLGAQLRAAGVDLSFTPVLDLDWGRSAVIGDRAFHRDPQVVSVLAACLMHGLALAGMSNCGKHFPGHGWTVADSHFDLAVDERAADELRRADVAPYAWLSTALDAVMPAHVIYPAVDTQPAGFSRRWIGDILRGELQFTGAVLSDDLCMAAARAAGDVVGAAHAALAAGCDYVLVCNDTLAAERLLAQLSWEHTPTFDERRARLVPRSAALTPAQVLGSERYRGALRDLARLQSQVPPDRA